MKRGGKLNRYTELRNQTPLPRGSSELPRSPLPARRTPLPRQRLPLSGSSLSRAARQAPMKRTRIKAKPVVRTREEVEARRIVAVRAGEWGWCEGCGQRPGREYSHRVAEGQCGPYDAANALWLCNDLAAPDGKRGCHQLAHAYPRWAREERGWILRSTDDYLTYPAWVHGVGWALLSSDGRVTPTERRTA